MFLGLSEQQEKLYYVCRRASQGKFKAMLQFPFWGVEFIPIEAIKLCHHVS